MTPVDREREQRLEWWVSLLIWIIAFLTVAVVGLLYLLVTR